MMNMQKGVSKFLVVCLVLFVLRILIGYLTVPPVLAMPVSILLAVCFIAGPIFGFFLASQDEWVAKKSLIWIAAGVASHVLGLLLVRGIHDDGSFIVQFFDALAQTGLLIWCVGLGSLLAVGLKDKNLLVPIAFFLAGLDMFLIFSPNSITKNLMKSAPAVFTSVAAKVPVVVSNASGVHVSPGVYVGPADFIFLGMFFVALHRFKMRSQSTMLAMIPVLLGYLMIVRLFGDITIGPISLAMLPALLPIGLTFLVVNRNEFTMLKSEKVMSAVVALIAVALGAAGIVLANKQRSSQGSQVELSPSEGIQVSPKSSGSPEKVNPNPGR